MIVLDTNIMYEISGVQPIRGNLLQIIKNEHDRIGTTSISLTEIISKYRNYLPMLRKAIAPFMNPDYSLYKIGYLPIDTQDIEIIMNVNKDSIANDKVNAIHELKIQKEAEFLRLILTSIIFATYHALIEERNTNVGLSNHKLFTSSAEIIGNNTKYVLDVFKEALNMGYSSGAPVQHCKKAFSALYAAHVFCFCANWHSLKTGISLLQFQIADKAQQQAIGNSTSQDSLVKLIKKDPNPFSVMARRKYKPSLTTAIDYLDKEFQGSFKSNSEMIRYILTRFEKILYDGGNMEKNDILDMLILVTLNDPDCRILTRDKNLKIFLSKNHSASALLNSKLTG